MHPTRPLHTLLIAASLGCVGAASAYAGNAFYVQVGSTSTEEEAASKWQELSSAHPNELSTLAMAIRRVMSVGGSTTEYRVQGGPTKSKLDAQRICSSLQTQSVDCFIVEAAVGNVEPAVVPAPSFAAYAQSVEASPAPVAAVESPSAFQLAAAQAEVEEEEYPSEGIFGWLERLFTSDRSDAPAPAETQQAVAPAAATGTPVVLPWLPGNPPSYAMGADAPAGNVEVAEAIPVPVSDIAMPMNAAPTSALYIPAEDAGWVRVSGFTSEQEAFGFSEAMHTRVPATLAMRTRIIRQLGAHNAHAPVSLKIGLVESDATISDICYFAANTNASLQCRALPLSGNRFIQYAQVAAPSPVAQPQPTAPDAPAAPVALTAAPAPAAASSVVVDSYSQYFVQLGAWHSRAEAMMQWDALMENHAALLKGRQPDLQTPARISVNAKPNVRLRTGPFDLRNDAETLCGKLSYVGVNCIVVRN